jgi:hypothetical protein
MSGQHTQGRLVVQPVTNPSLHDAGPAILQIEGTRIAVAGRATVEDARRLAACWNTLQAFSTEEIEQGIDLVERIEQGIEARKQLTTSRALLAEVLGVHDAAFDYDVSGVFVDEFAERIRAFLKGGA